MNVREFLKNNITVLDGGMGTLLQRAGLNPGELPETWNLTHPEEVERIHRAYFEAGSNIVCANTFGANSLKFSDGELDAIVKCAMEIAMTARERANGENERFIALDLGPTGKNAGALRRPGL